MAEQSTEKSFLMLVKGISKSPSSIKKNKGTRAPWRKRLGWQLRMPNRKYKRVKWQTRCLWENWKRRKERNISNLKLYFRAKLNVRSYLHLLKKLLGRQDGSVDKGTAAKPRGFYPQSTHDGKRKPTPKNCPLISTYAPCLQVFRKQPRGNRLEGSQWEKINDYA